MEIQLNDLNQLFLPMEGEFWLAEKALTSAIHWYKKNYIVVINEKKNEKPEKKETHVTTRMEFHDHSI